MEQQINQSVKKVNQYSLMSILATTLLIFGIFSLIGAIGSTYIDIAFTGKASSPLFGLFVSTGAIIFSFGLRKTRKWALYGITAFLLITILWILISIKFNVAYFIYNFNYTLILTLILVIYSWIIRKKFS